MSAGAASKRTAALASVLAISCACGARDREAVVGDVVHVLDDQGQAIDLRVDGVTPDPRDADDEIRLYAVSVKKDGAWVPYCMPDIEGRQAAIPVQGAWDAALGQLHTGKDTFTFACTSGAIGKCIRFGYRPWKGARAADLHAACTRMVRADYCGDGRPHTVDGTLIDIYDVDGIQKEEPTPGTLEQFEAGWSKDGATFLNLPRLTDDVQKIVDECPAHFGRGRSSLGGSLSAAQVQERFKETLLFNNRTRKVQ